MNGWASVFLTSSSEHDDDNNELTDLLGLQDRSEINDSGSDIIEEHTPTQPSKSPTTQYLMSELQSSINHKKKKILQSSGQWWTKKNYSAGNFFQRIASTFPLTDNSWPSSTH